MSPEAAPSQPTLLERIDLALAERLASASEERLLADAERRTTAIYRSQDGDPAWIAGLLRLRGMEVDDEDVLRLRDGRRSRYEPHHQEARLIAGAERVLQAIRDGASQGTRPDGWFMVELFKTLTLGVARFHNNHVRRDAPWDGVLHVSYPAADEMQYLLRTFDADRRYRDLPARFDALHPVRQSFQLLWRLARMAPFPDLNLPMAWVGMCSWLLVHGYPAIAPRPTDRDVLLRIVKGGPPSRIPALEHRVLDAVCAL